MHRPRIEFDIECTIRGPQKSKYLAEFTIFAHNRGGIKFTFREIRLRVRGLAKDHELLLWEDHANRLVFPVSVINEQVIPPRFDYFFVEPGVRQAITYVTAIPEDITFIIARASFRYRFRKDVQTTERVFEISRRQP